MHRRIIGLSDSHAVRSRSDAVIAMLLESGHSTAGHYFGMQQRKIQRIQRTIRPHSWGIAPILVELHSRRGYYGLPQSYYGCIENSTLWVQLMNDGIQVLKSCVIIAKSRHDCSLPFNRNSIKLLNICSWDFQRQLWRFSGDSLLRSHGGTAYLVEHLPRELLRTVLVWSEPVVAYVPRSCWSRFVALLAIIQLYAQKRTRTQFTQINIRFKAPTRHKIKFIAALS